MTENKGVVITHNKSHETQKKMTIVTVGGMIGVGR